MLFLGMFVSRHRRKTPWSKNPFVMISIFIDLINFVQPRSFVRSLVREHLPIANHANRFISPIKGHTHFAAAATFKCYKSNYFQ